MPHGTAHDLPAGPSGLTGWPWMEETPPLPERTPDGRPWPRISIVTPSFNQGQFIEETIRSVLLQGYPNLEYIIMDGGSTDGTVEIIRKYEPWLAYWVSEPDRGQSHAINKGMAMSTGEVCGWLCSDDLLLPGALVEVGQSFAEHADWAWLAGAGDLLYADGVIVNQSSGIDDNLSLLQYWEFGSPGHYVCQPSSFWRRALWDKVGGLNEQNHLAMDIELWLAFEEFALLHGIPSTLSVSRMHPGSKTDSRRRAQVVVHMRCAYDAARRRGLRALSLTTRMFPWVFANRVRRIRACARARWKGGILSNAIAMLADPIRMWWEAGRGNILGPRRK